MGRLPRSALSQFAQTVMEQDFRTYWVIDNERVTNFGTVQRRVLAGATAIEVSVVQQKVMAQNRKKQAEAYAVEQDRLRQAAAEQKHSSSPEGQAESARRTALQNPGGIISGGDNVFAELDRYSPTKTNLLK